MAGNKNPFYQVLVYLAYAFFIIMGGLWFAQYYISTGRFNVWAFFIVLIFAVQAWYRNKLVNLLLGVISLAMSIFMTIEVMADFNVLDPRATLDGWQKALVCFSVTSIVMSGILMFSYLMFNKVLEK